MEAYTHFATFGSDHLKDFGINPTEIMLVTDDEQKLREILRQEPFNNQYFTTYPISYGKKMEEKYGMKFITLGDLIKSYNNKAELEKIVLNRLELISALLKDKQEDTIKVSKDIKN